MYCFCLSYFKQYRYDQRFASKKRKDMGMKT
jgi:hypothetical protein